ncbi:MAG: ATP-dependent zinc metalloprotease FtsH [Candidatus Sumerlaeota bacterium]|nr:ATP-dependent zinc metalloprotease FtsH [Candidatus Sumerlaeota bacterium]
MSTLKSASLWIIIFLLFILVFMRSWQGEQRQELTLTQFLEKARAGQVKSAVDSGGTIEGEYISPTDKNTRVPYQVRYIQGEQSSWLAEELIKDGVEYQANEHSNMLQQLLLSVVIPIVVLVGLWVIFMRQIQSGGAKAMSFGKSRAKLVSEGQVKITFEDVAGVDEAKEELQEIVEFLKDPRKFSRLGGKIPKGVLLYGRPGTGKTLLAKAVAGEASVPFFSISGSDFVEMFVGVGASRVRDLFEQGKRSKPCLIFIDEIDAVGRHRFTGIGGGHDEREQTLNQLLVEMDGFNSNEGVILIAATNRPDVLDPALLRPGRFDRQIAVDFPDVKGREKILRVHSRGVKLDPAADLRLIAKGTPGFCGADLANLINEAALLAARRGRQMVKQPDLEEAKDRVMMGPERRSLALSHKEKELTAYHEAGHAIVQSLLPGSDPIHKVTIVPRGRSLGLTAALPEEDRHNLSYKHLKNDLATLLAGRASEKLRFEDYSTGASNDIQRATHIAYRMVCEFGMSDRLGPRMFGEPSGEVFLGKELARERNFSDQTAAEIDAEVKRLLDEAYGTASQILNEHKDTLRHVAETLMERESLNGQELQDVIEGKPLSPLVVDEEPPSPAEAPVESKPSTPKPATPIVLDRPREQPS